MSRYAVPVIFLVLIGGFFLRGLYLEPGEIESPLVGQQAPSFSLPNLEDPTKQVSADDLAGSFSLLNVWATWCPECYREHDFLMQLADRGIRIYGLNWQEERREDALDYLETMGNPYVAVAEDSVGDVAIDWGVYGAPETFLIGPDGTILHKYIRALTAEVWEREFLPVIEAHQQ